MESNTCLQLILGSDKRNPSLEVYQDESEKHFYVYYGFELLVGAIDCAGWPKLSGF
jgi:hypothetical protein